MKKGVISLALLLGLAGCGSPREYNYCFNGSTYVRCESSSENSNPGNSPGNSRPASPQSQNIEGVRLSQSSADSSGKVYFQEGREEVTIKLQEEDGSLISEPEKAKVLYFDGSDFECFKVDHPVYTTRLSCFPHNSEHLISLTPASLQVLHPENYTSGNDFDAVNNFADWNVGNGDYLGCWDKQQLEALIDQGVYIFRKIAGIFTLGLSEDFIDKAVDYLKDNLDEEMVGDVYVIIPSKHGFPGTTSVSTVLIRPRSYPGECGSGGCLPNAGKECHQGEVWSKDSCGNLENIVSYCYSGCFEGSCLSPDRESCPPTDDHPLYLQDNFSSLDVCRWESVGDVTSDGSGMMLNDASLYSRDVFDCPQDFDFSYRFRAFGTSPFYVMGLSGLPVFFNADAHPGELILGCQQFDMVEINSYNPVVENSFAFRRTGGQLKVTYNGNVVYSGSCSVDRGIIAIYGGEDGLKFDEIEFNCK